ncbi:serine hydrolase [Spirosoma endophyticum]|uniref:CubicO group peptidase, beta-lactamase class C family n=1 Tax=Spirosoma endophyticum TaxID=662367 RepID=A0A1I1VHP0_9BACT|nr:serine hydrolase [Spirosoma endophyticum]SFD80593.1 CubicO group peptidase, beta-lactamase class C family [Spirosoma endophyticum]
MTASRLSIVTLGLAATLTFSYGQSRPAPSTTSGSTQKSVDSLDRFLRDKMSQLSIPGMQVAVVQRGQLVLNKSYGFANLQDSVPVTHKSIFAINSCTKAFTGVAIMQLVEDGKVDLAAPISRYVDDLPTDWQPVTIRQLLTHVSGIPDILRVLSPSTGGLADLGSEEAAWEAVKKRPMDFRTGEQFSYNQTNYVLLGKVIDKLHTKPFAQVFSEQQFQPAGMSNTVFGDSRDVLPHFAPTYSLKTSLDGHKLSEAKLTNNYAEFPASRRTASGLNSTAEDMAHWIIALQQGKLLKTKAALNTLWSPGTYSNGSPTQWALGWGLTKFRPKHRAVGMSGGGRSAFLVYPDDDLAVIVLTNLGGSSPENFIEELAGYFNPDIPQSDPITALRLQVQKRGFDQAIPVGNELKKRNLQPDENELNDWAYRVMSSGQAKEALELFKLNVSLYPESWNTYDSLAEGYERLGNQALAIENYKRSLAMNPENANATGHLKKLAQGSK